MARILLTGASGLLGINFVMAHKDQHEITAVVNTRPFALDGVQVLQADLEQPDALTHIFERAQPDWVVHAAAMANLEDCDRQPERAHAINAELPGTVARLARQASARTLLISTDAVFDGQRQGYTEDDPPAPLSVYARTKLAGEQAALAADPEALVARVNFYGWSRSGQRSLAEFFYNNLMAGEPIKGFNDVFFSPLLATDLAQLLVRMLEARLSGVYHTLSSESLSKYEFGQRIAQLFGFADTLIEPVSVHAAGLAAQRAPDLRLSTAKLSAALGETLPDITAGLVHWFAQHRSGYPARLQAL